MTAHDSEFANKITTYLDAATRDLKSGTVYRLQQARSAALAHLSDPLQASQRQMALAGGGTSGGLKPFYTQLRFWVGIAVIAFAVLGWQQWQVYQTVKDAEEIDAELLTSDLPIDAYLDRGFQVWLKTGDLR